MNAQPYDPGLDGRRRDPAGDKPPPYRVGATSSVALDRRARAGFPAPKRPILPRMSVSGSLRPAVSP